MEQGIKITSELAEYQDFNVFIKSLGPQTIHNFDHFIYDYTYQTFFAYDGESIVGYGFLRKAIHPRKKHMCILGMVVTDAWQDKGIGTRLAKYMIDWARTSGKYKKIALGVYADNTRAISFYMNLGFVPEGQLINEEFYNGGYRSLVTMAMYLT